MQPRSHSHGVEQQDRDVKDNAVVHVHVQRLSGVWAPMRPDPHYNHPPSDQSPNDGMIMMR